MEDKLGGVPTKLFAVLDGGHLYTNHNVLSTASETYITILPMLQIQTCRLTAYMDKLSSLRITRCLSSYENR